MQTCMFRLLSVRVHNDNGIRSIVFQFVDSSLSQVLAHATMMPFSTATQCHSCTNCINRAYEMQVDHSIASILIDCALRLRWWERFFFNDAIQWCTTLRRCGTFWTVLFYGCTECTRSIIESRSLPMCEYIYSFLSPTQFVFLFFHVFSPDRASVRDKTNMNFENERKISCALCSLSTALNTC